MSNRVLLLFSLVQTVLLFLVALNTTPVARATDAQEVTIVDQRLSNYRPLPVRVTGDIDCKCK